LVNDSGCSRHMTRDKGWYSSLIPVVSRTYITFGDNGRWCVLSDGEIKVSDKVTLRRVALVQSLGFNLLFVSVRNRMLISLRGGGGELGNLKP
jgi:hypothetical protein